jgi:transmembrane sensor
MQHPTHAAAPAEAGPPPSPPPSPADTALEWIVRLNSGTASQADRQAYEDWKSSGPEPMRAAAAAERLWAGLGPALKRPRRARARRQAGTALAVAASAVTAAVGSGLFGPPATLLADQRTGTGERRSVTLADGSHVALDAASAFDVDFSHGQRKLRLLAGRIHVQVAPDAARPFDVEASGGTTRALGTAFLVRKDEDAVEVAVTEHAVRVRGPQDGAEGGVVVQAGQQVRYPAQGTAGAPAAADLNALTAWQRGRIVFVDRPLGEVVAELRRYRPGFVVLRGDAVGRLAVTGAFDSRNTDELLQALEATLPVRVRRLPWLTVIEPAPRPAPAAPAGLSPGLPTK